MEDDDDGMVQYADNTFEPVVGDEDDSREGICTVAPTEGSIMGNDIHVCDVESAIVVSYDTAVSREASKTEGYVHTMHTTLGFRSLQNFPNRR